MDPSIFPRATVAFVRFGLSLWTRLLGKKTVPVLVTLTALSTLVVVVIEGCGIA